MTILGAGKTAVAADGRKAPVVSTGTRALARRRALPTAFARHEISWAALRDGLLRVRFEAGGAI